MNYWEGERPRGKQKRMKQAGFILGKEPTWFAATKRRVRARGLHRGCRPGPLTRRHEGQPGALPRTVPWQPKASFAKAIHTTSNSSAHWKWTGQVARASRLPRNRPTLASRSADSLVRRLLKWGLADKAVRAPNRLSRTKHPPCGNHFRFLPTNKARMPVHFNGLARTLALPKAHRR